MPPPAIGSAEWACSCGAVNPNARAHCGQCGASRPAIATDNFSGVWRCSCSGVTALNRSTCDHCSVRRPRSHSASPDASPSSAGEWRCSCGTMNSAALNACSACHMQRLRYSDSAAFHARKTHSS